MLSGGPMLDGWHEGELVGSGMVIWKSRRKLAAGEITEAEFLERACASAPRQATALVEEAEIARRRAEAPPPIPESRTPWEELYREKTGQLAEGRCRRWP